MIVLDLSGPGTNPATLVAATRSVGAQGVAGYLRNWPEWTREMAQAVLKAWLQFLPIELYDGQAPTATLARLMDWGLPKGPVAMDVEAGSWPTDAWQLSWQQSIDAAGYISVGYSQAAAGVPYRLRWGAKYTWPGQPDQMTLQPIQAIPTWLDAVQYAHDFAIGGLTFDASNFSFALMKEDPSMARLVQGDQKPGLAFLALDPVFGPKRGVPDPAWLASYQGALAAAGVDQATLTIPQQVLDAMESEAGYENFDPNAVTAALQAIQMSLASLTTGIGLTAAQQAELDAINQATTALSRHLGVGTA